jgi:tryptophan synthase alpha chain
MNPIDALFEDLRQKGHKAFMPFITAGDPSLDATKLVAQELARRGASLIEVGFPYSDPIADGSVIQASYTRALSAGVTIDAVFNATHALKVSVPLVAMVSFSLVHRRGPLPFIEKAQASGLSGAIVPDLPVDESADLVRIANTRDFKLIHLITPTTPRERAAHIARNSTGFLYCVSITGITGERAEIPAELIDQLEWLRSETKLPLCVGFGISKPEHVTMLRPHVDGVIVGSALVRRMEQARQRPVADVVREVGDLAESLAKALNP